MNLQTIVISLALAVMPGCCSVVEVGISDDSKKNEILQDDDKRKQKNDKHILHQGKFFSW